MSDTVKNAIPVWVPRVVGVLAAWLVGWAAEHKMALDEETIVVLMLAAYSFLHRAISNRVNPGDAATSSVAKQEKAQAARSE